MFKISTGKWPQWPTSTIHELIKTITHYPTIPIHHQKSKPPKPNHKNDIKLWIDYKKFITWLCECAALCSEVALCRHSVSTMAPCFGGRKRRERRYQRRPLWGLISDTSCKTSPLFLLRSRLAQVKIVVSVSRFLRLIFTVLFIFLLGKIGGSFS